MGNRVTHNRKTSAGFTLIEVLVVMLIVALVASTVALNLPPAKNEAGTEADRFAMRISAASEQAVMSGTLIGLELSPGEYHFFEYHRGEWNDVENPRLGAGRFPADIAVEFSLPEPARRNEADAGPLKADDAPAPVIFFTPTGETTALEMTFRARRKRSSLTLDTAGSIKVVRHDEG